MSRKLKFLIKESLKKKTSSKWFKVVNILLFIAIIGLLNIDSIIKKFGGDFDEATNIKVIDEVGVYDSFNAIVNEGYIDYFKDSNIKLEHTSEDFNVVKEQIKKDKSNDILIYINHSENTFDVEIASYKYIDAILYSSLTSAINATKTNYALMNSNIDKNELANIYEQVKIERIVLNEKLDKDQELMTFLGGILIVVVIVPIFFLIIIMVQMIGAEISEEKTSRSMEIIISSVSPKEHFISKIFATNIFVLAQGGLLLLFIFVGVLVRSKITPGGLTEIAAGLGAGNVNELIQELLHSEILSKFLLAIPFILVMIILTFLAYSLLTGILASMTNSMEDYQHLQFPITMILLLGYYLSIVASMYPGSIFVKVVSYVPYISGILSPILYILGQTTIIDLLISIVLLFGVNFLLIKYGLRIYKVGILNYSSAKLWKKIFKAVKE